MAMKKLIEAFTAKPVTDIEVSVANQQQPVVDSTVEEMKKQLEAAKLGREEDHAKILAEREARLAAEKEREELSKRYSTSEVQNIQATERDLDNTLSRATLELERIKKDLSAAYDAPTIDKNSIIDLQEQLADKKYELNTIKDKKGQFLLRKEQEIKKAMAISQQQQVAVYSDSDQKWIDKHPKFETDDKYREIVFGAHHNALRKGITVSTPAYYEYIESRLKEFGLEGNEEETKPTQKKIINSTSASVSYSSPTGSNNNKANKVTLTPEQQKFAISQFGPNSMHKKSPEQAMIEYAKYL
jgi:hypothetical protein